MNLHDEVEKIKGEGYSEANAEAKLCQDIVLKTIAESGMGRNATIKGGVVMRSISKNARRATQDLDLDFIRYSISDESIKRFIEKLNFNKDNEKNFIMEKEGAAVVNDDCASLPSGTVTRTIGKTTYIANLHFKSQGQTFSQKLKRVLRADCSM